ncbi:arylsulfatase K [Geobacter sp. OR-1]|uniref:sulfatase n=1 Tax=Geobacter sp. OR-1 TaxID=1266765 RepID=UPI0005426129|nr:sulfatase [Geobacter sp. OR-1]GAM09274.1 arylsulfatase K [Geobacter sp. OR-1]
MTQHNEHDAISSKEMDRREFLRRTALATGAIAATMSIPGLMTGIANAAEAKLPLKYKDYNVVFVSFDALQAAHVGSLGYSRNVTPTIDAMAKKGFNFTNTISVASWTVPASMTWFTGVYPSEHRLTNKFAIFNPPSNNVLSNLKKLSPELVTLAEVLKQNGYATGGFTGNAGVSGFFGYDQGFDQYFFEKGKFGSMGVSIPKALDWLKENKNKKFFMFLHGYDCHGQNIPEGGFDYRFVDKGYDKKYTGSAKEQEALREEGLEKGSVAVRDEDVKFWRAIYDEKIQRTDARFKKFLEEYEKMGLLDKTIFVLTSDHGTEFFEHKHMDHGFSLYDELIHVPLVITLPKQKSGKIITDQISSIDVMPTILDLLDVKMPEKAKNQLRGASLVPAMKGKSVAKEVYSETDYRQYTYKRSVITKDGWKFIYTLENKNRELYNLKKDPKELKNVVDQEPRIAYELEQKLFAHFKSIGHDLSAKQWIPGLNPVYDSQAKGAVKK